METVASSESIAQIGPEEVRKALARAAWLLGLSEFCELLGWARDEYAKAKFLRFQEMATSAGQFDEDVWAKIVAWGHANRRPQP